MSIYFTLANSLKRVVGNDHDVDMYIHHGPSQSGSHYEYDPIQFKFPMLPITYRS